MYKRKFLCLFFALILSLGILSSCGSSDEGTDTEPFTDGIADNVKTTDILAAIEAVYTDLPAHTNKDSVNDKPTDFQLSSWFSPELSLDDNSNIVLPSAFLGIEEYALHMPAGKSAVEICVFKAKSSEDVESINAMCVETLARIKASDLALYDAQAASAVFSSATIYIKGKYVCLLCVENVEGAKAAVDNLIINK